MKRRLLHFVAPLSNVDDSIQGIRLVPGFRIEKWSVDKLTGLINETFSGSDKSETKINIEHSCCLPEGQKHVFVVYGKIHAEGYWKEPPSSASFEEKWLDRGRYFGKIKDKIVLMRLFTEGHIDLTQYYIYEKKNDPVMCMDSGSLFPLPIAYTLTQRERIKLNQFLKKYQLPFSPPYIQLAFENFNQSYNIQELNLCFLTLMIAVEVLFNDGQQELKYRITRGMAVLIGNTYDESLEIYSTMRKIYDKRSLLVHTGKDKDLSYDDIFLLRYYLRRSIIKVLDLGIEKTELSKKLTGSGFGKSIA